MFSLVAASQRFLCDAATPRQPLQDALARLLRSVPEPRKRIEDFLLRSILARLVVLVSGQDRRAHIQTRQMAHAVAAILVNEDVTPQQTFARWVRRQSSRTRTFHDVDLVSLIVQRSLFETSDLRALANEFGHSERAARKAFKRAYGVTPRTYKRRTKVLCAIQLLRKETWDNDSVARHLGFRSPKNLYRLLWLETGLTPRQIRRLSERELEKLRMRIAPAQGRAVQATVAAPAGPAPRIKGRRGNGEAAAGRQKAV